MSESSADKNTPSATTNDESALDAEIQALSQVTKLLEQLPSDARERVVAYVFQRLAIKLPSTAAPISQAGMLSDVHFEETRPTSTSSIGVTWQQVKDIRSFAEEKQPESATEKAAIVAFFLDELAPSSERMPSIGQEEITKYFKQAGFPLPASPSMTLVHAKNAGYFETVGPGQYRLNPVGYNLVVHRLPKSSSSGSRPSVKKRPAKKSVKKGVAKKAKK